MSDTEQTPAGPGGGEAEASPKPCDQTDISFSGGLADLLRGQQISIAFTSYQSGNLYLLGCAETGALSLHQAVYPKAMGVIGDGDRLYLGSLAQVVRMENVLAPDQRVNAKHDKVYVPRNFQTTGDVDIHELGVRADGRVVFVNTRWSCLAELSRTHSFKPIWKPAFISKLAPEDRCHLNGLAMVDGRPKFVTAACRSDVVDGWRDRRADGGVVIDVETDEILCEGLSMPHSPRWHDGRLWLLNSGSGELGWVDPKTKRFKPEAFCPGFLRGLAFHNGHAFVTLSRPRYKRFEGLALDAALAEKDADAWCGVQVISLSDGSVAHWIRLDGAIQELFDITILPGVQDAITLGPSSAEIQNFITIDPAP